MNQNIDRAHQMAQWLELMVHAVSTAKYAVSTPQPTEHFREMSSPLSPLFNSVALLKSPGPTHFLFLNRKSYYYSFRDVKMYSKDNNTLLLPYLPLCPTSKSEEMFYKGDV